MSAADYEPATDPEYERWLAKLAKECRCEPCCNSVPCDGLCAGGFCDFFACRCGENGGGDYPDYEDDEP